MIDNATIADLDEIIEIENSSFSADKFSVRQFKYLLSKAKSIFKVIRIDNKVSAYLILLYRKDSEKIRIYSIAVSLQSRGKGLADRLMDFTTVYAKTHNFTDIHLEVRADNVSAISLYEKSNFKKSGVKKGYYQDGIDAIIMCKEVTT